MNTFYVTFNIVITIYMFSWLFPFCYKEHETNEKIYHVRFSRTTRVRIIPNRYEVDKKKGC